jgi:deoxyribodipyrimidine photolyase-related protein
MERAIFLIFPNQLFELAPRIQEVNEVWLLEDELFFKQYPFHQKKLAFHRASMQYYAEKLRSENKIVRYWKHDGLQLESVFHQMSLQGAAVYCYDPIDYLLERRLKRYALKFGLAIHFHENPGFFNSSQTNTQLIPSTSQKYFMADFYKKQRLKHGILLEPDGSPVGGRWSFDTENRKALPKGISLPEFPKYTSQWASNAITEISKEFPKNPGNPSLKAYPVTHQEAKQALDFFIEHCLTQFGPFQDAFSTQSIYVYHSNLSTAINAGLLLPQEVVSKVVEAYQKGKVTIESAEGFIRQIIGWREFVRLVYERVGVTQRTKNFMQHQRPLHWEQLKKAALFQELGQKIDRFAYAHHIERLMLLGNFFFLSEFHPDAVYEFFMVHFMDAYDWVMVPNVYGMSQFADGGLMTTKPYFSSSNYLKKQGLKFESEDAVLFDALFWHFVDKHQEYLRKNMRTAQMVANWNRIAPEKKAAHLERAALYFQELESLTA